MAKAARNVCSDLDNNQIYRLALTWQVLITRKEHTHGTNVFVCFLVSKKHAFKDKHFLLVMVKSKVDLTLHLMEISKKRKTLITDFNCGVNKLSLFVQ